MNRKISILQDTYLRNSATAVAALAKLRRAVNTPPGADPRIWFDLFDEIPKPLLGHAEEPSTYERAIHAALTLYATHQQSQSTRMHQPKYPLGRSIRLLAKRTGTDADDNTSPVLRRFHALGTAGSLPETLHHLRGLITQLRSQGVALDYGLLSRDLRRLQDPRTAAGVRLTWGRDYHRTPVDAATTSPETSTDEQ